MKIFVYDTINHRFEVFTKEPYMLMPYMSEGGLLVKEFCPIGDVCWTTKQTLRSYERTMDLVKQSFQISAAFVTLPELPTNTSASHTSGVALDLEINNPQEQLEIFRTLASNNVWNAIQDPEHTPGFLHLENSYLPACNDYISYPILRYQMINTYVLILQQALISLGYMGTMHLSGIFDDLTLQNVQDFQKNTKLKPDGIVGAKTWEHLIYAFN